MTNLPDLIYVEAQLSSVSTAELLAELGRRRDVEAAERLTSLETLLSLCDKVNVACDTVLATINQGETQ